MNLEIDPIIDVYLRDRMRWLQIEIELNHLDAFNKLVDHYKLEDSSLKHINTRLYLYLTKHNNGDVQCFTSNTNHFTGPSTGVISEFIKLSEVILKPEIDEC